jgi:hypothetical protein
LVSLKGLQPGLHGLAALSPGHRTDGGHVTH